MPGSEENHHVSEGHSTKELKVGLVQMLGSTSALVVVLLAACTAPDTRILPENLNLPVAAGDRWKLCADDGLEDTTPTADCVLAPVDEPMKGYVAALEADGWVKAETSPTGERWTRDGAACGILAISGVRETYARKDYTLLRFAVTCG